jgi:hypothetical protein
MNAFHATDEQLQQHAINAMELPGQVRDHIKACRKCLNAATTYHTLFTHVHDQHPPRFDFDLESSVIRKLQSRRTSPSQWRISIAAMIATALLVMIVPLTMLSTVFREIVSNLSVWTIYIIATITIVVLIANLIEMHFRFKGKITAIEEY